MPQKGSVLVVIAHPDDELFVSGTLCLLNERGYTTYLVCATDRGAGPAMTPRWSRCAESAGSS